MAMLHGTFHNDDYQCNTASQHCRDIVIKWLKKSFNIVVLKIVVAVVSCNITFKRLISSPLHESYQNEFNRYQKHIKNNCITSLAWKRNPLFCLNGYVPLNRVIGFHGLQSILKFKQGNQFHYACIVTLFGTLTTRLRQKDSFPFTRVNRSDHSLGKR